MRALVIAAALGSCGDNRSTRPDDAPGDNMPPRGYRQVEHLGRPGVSQLLLVSTDVATSYNAAAPKLLDLGANDSRRLVAEAKTVLKALYLGACLANGSVAAGARVSPAGFTCHAIGTALFDATEPTGATLTMASRTAAQAYADAVYTRLQPDVLRIDTTTPSHYETPCELLWCGGRLLDDDVIDITLAYLLDGSEAPANPSVYAQRGALVSDGVNFSATARGSRTPAAPNPQQGHSPVSGTFPFGAAPF